MGEIKFNHICLADCKTQIDYIARMLQQNIDEAMVLINKAAEPNKQYELIRSVKSIAMSIDELHVMSGKIASLSELYDDCERTVERIVQRLSVPVSIYPRQSALSTSTPFFEPKYSASHTMQRDLVVESWIMELIYLEGS